MATESTEGHGKIKSNKVVSYVETVGARHPPLPPGRLQGEGESVTTGIARVERLARAMWAVA